jgi:hypothetical protein
MPLAADTSPDANAVQIEAYRRMGGTGRAQVMFHLGEMARQTTAAGIRSRHPDYDDELDELPPEFELPVGAGGAAAIYTAGGKPLRIIRKVIIRTTAWFSYF